eukprot:SAG22_NODE_7160_length_770_cov_0.715350_1_plen_56_part_10
MVGRDEQRVEVGCRRDLRRQAVEELERLWRVRLRLLDKVLLDRLGDGLERVPLSSA